LHNHTSNKILRRLATRAVLSEACGNMSSYQCNVCGLQFQPSPHFHFSTNMWTARCDYIAKIFVPLEYARLRKKMCTLDERGEMGLCDPGVSGSATSEVQRNGLGRFAMEWWVGSHPHFNPCHVYTRRLDKFMTGWEPQFRPKLKHGSMEELPSFMHRRVLRQMRQTIYLSDDKDAVCSLYRRIIPEAKSCDDLSGIGPGNSSTALSLGVHSTREFVAENPTQPDHAIFYNVYIPEVQNPEGYASNIVQEQLSQIVNNKSSELPDNTLLFYSMIGSNKTLDCPEGLSCQLLGYHPKGYEEVTLTELHRYCQAHQSSIVTYLHNKGSLHGHGQQKVLRRLATRSTLSQECMGMRRRKGCNVCGLQFQRSPHLHFSSNMWTAHCDYIAQLFSPREYAEKRMEMCLLYEARRDPNNDTYFCEPGTSLDDNMTESVAQTNGLGRHAMEFWVGSHPSLNPCHVYTERLDMFMSGWDSWWEPKLTHGGVSVVPPYIRRRVIRQMLQSGYLYGHDMQDICYLLHRIIQKARCEVLRKTGTL